ncbi:MAG: PKD domain-containing protein, partial [Dehalococcoidia bacterium]|nr:PKD domain-containing protein [Dehalococcoidia bacterium]
YLVIVGIVVAAVALSILFYTMLANHRPVITGLEAQPERVLPRGSCQIVCNATDPDGDELSYGWSANGGGITGEGATVTWTAPGSVGSYNVTALVIDSRGGGVTDYVTITVRANNPPTISSLVANADWTLPSGNLQVTCNATDPDGDELSYEWTATGGNITGTGAVVNWSAPQEVGIYNVTVVVKDGHGREDTRFVSLSVALGTPPTIEDLIVTAKEPKYLRTISAGYYKVGKTKQYDIECTVSDTSGEVSYEWSCEDGAISGEGSMITWTAPDETLTRTTVTVIVSDIAGNRVSKSVDFQVVSCSACTFG